MPKRKQEAYTLSLEGVIDDDEVYDRVELYMLRFGHNAIVRLPDGVMMFTTVESKAKGVTHGA